MRGFTFATLGAMASAIRLPVETKDVNQLFDVIVDVFDGDGDGKLRMSEWLAFAEYIDCDQTLTTTEKKYQKEKFKELRDNQQDWSEEYLAYWLMDALSSEVVPDGMGYNMSLDCFTKFMEKLGQS